MHRNRLVHVVSYMDYDIREILGVFSSADRAHAFIEERPKSDHPHLVISTERLNDPDWSFQEWVRQHPITASEQCKEENE